MAIKHRNLDGYGAQPIGWDRVQQTMAMRLPGAPGMGGPSRRTAWLTTVDSLGMPQVRPVGLVRRDTTWYFNASPDTVNVRNIASEPRCVLSPVTDPFDLVVEGAAVRVTDVAVDSSRVYAVGTSEPFGATRFDA